MTIKHLARAALISLAVGITSVAVALPASASDDQLSAFVGAEPELFGTPEEAAAAFTNLVAKDDLAAIAKLLGLNPEKLASADNIRDTLEQVRAAAAAKVVVRDDGEQRILVLGPELWPFPFPLVRDQNGKWGFDTIAGLEEIVNRRIGQNELHAIDTVRLFVEAQRDYAAEDRDADGVLEFAQKLVSSEGLTDGLYWPVEQGDGDSPAGAIDQAALDKAKAGDGYFGYRFRILKRQGDNVAGGAYDYVINGNMIGGFALIAWPASYARTGVSTFAVNQAGIVYERDFGPDTENIVAKIKTFNPGDGWQVVED